MEPEPKCPQPGEGRDKEAPAPSSGYASIADCETCNRLPQKAAEDIEATGVPKVVPPEVERLSVVVELDDENTPAYCVSTTRLLKCPFCGTHYYWNHYDDDGQHFMDPTCDLITLRRYDPLSALEFLERVVARAPNALPGAFGQLRKAWVEGASRPDTGIAPAGLDSKVQAAAADLVELRGRYDEIMGDLADILWRRALPGQIQMYAVESLGRHFVSRGDRASLTTLLRHPDPAVRVLTAKLVIGLGTDDAPIMDLLHVSREMRQALAKELARKSRLDELVDVLLEIALFPSEAMIWEYDHGYGSSSYYQTSVRWIALYYLCVLAHHGADLERAIPALVGLLGEDQRLTSDAGRVLRAIVDQKKKTARLLRCARLILDEIEKARAARHPKLPRDAHVKALVARCNELLGKPTTPKRKGSGLHS
ncbi:MAG: hypothetical protein AB1641_29325 [Thermodesulfobacteriota bacterium]